MVVGNLFVGHFDEALNALYILGLNGDMRKGLRLFKADFLALNGVDEVLFDAGQILLAYTFYSIDIGALDEGALLLGEELNTLGGAVGALVVLTREVGHGKDFVVLAELNFLKVDVVYGRLGENRGYCSVELLLGHSLDVVADELTHILHLDFKEIFYLLLNLFCLQVVLFFNKYPVYHVNPLCI